VGSHENARNLLSHDPSVELARSATGSKLARNCFSYVTRWLIHLREYVYSDEVFLNQLLEPARSAARFKIEIESMTDVAALVFSKSAAFNDPFFEGKVTTLSLIVPALESSLSIRCREQVSESVKYGMYNVGGVQPLPYVNRIHPVRPSMKRLETQIGLGGLDFLKVAPADLQSFSNTLAVENYCEIESLQMRKRRLGAVCVVSGRLVSTMLPQLTLQSLSDPEVSVPFLATSHLLSNMDCDGKGVTSLDGQNVRLLCSVWYTCGKKEESLYPEVFYIEPVADPTELLWDEIIGEVRLHGPRSLDAVASRFAHELKDTMVPRVLELDSERFLRRSTRRTPVDRCTQIFLKEKEHLTELRQYLGGHDKESCIVFPRSEILDHMKLRQDMLVRRLAKDQLLNDCLVSLLRRQDSDGEIAQSFSALIKSVTESERDIFREQLWWLRDFGFLAKTHSGMNLTERGIEIAYLAMQDFIARSAQEAVRPHRQEIISLADLAVRTHLPPSLVLMALREFREQPLRCLNIDGKPCELFWIPHHCEETDAGIRKLAELESKILGVLRQVSYSLATAKILDNIRTEAMTHFILLILLNEMKSRAIITEPDEGMWFYSWEKRIQDTLSTAPYPVLTTDQLIKATGIPHVDRAQVCQILRKLEDTHVVTELEKDKWALRSSDQGIKRGQLQWLLGEECGNYILTEVSAQGGWMHADRLLSETKSFLRKRMEPFGRTDELETQVYECCLQELQRQGKIGVVGSVIRLIRNKT